MLREVNQSAAADVRFGLGRVVTALAFTWIILSMVQGLASFSLKGSWSFFFFRILFFRRRALLESMYAQSTPPPFRCSTPGAYTLIRFGSDRFSVKLLLEQVLGRATFHFPFNSPLDGSLMASPLV